MKSMQQAPVRNESVIGAQVYSHSGEFSPQVFDLEVPSRGLSFQFVRKYRSALSGEIGPLGRGWTFTYARRLEQDGADVLYHDGFGGVHRFSLAPDGGFSPPDGFYAVLLLEGDRFFLKQRFGDLYRFARPEAGGCLLAIEDRNGNALRFEYRDQAIAVIDPFSREMLIRLEQDRVVEVKDHTGRGWQYFYDENACLVAVIQPAIHGVPDRPRVHYTYDQAFRLVSIVDPKDQTLLRNSYDSQGRVRHQDHGDGAFDFEYEPSNPVGGPSVLTTRVKLKNGGWLRLIHDAGGRVVESTLYVTPGSLLPADRIGEHDGKVPLTTTSTYNRHGELVQRCYPAGDSTEWLYDHDNPNPLAQGNLLQVSQIPAPGSDEEALPLVTRYTYEPLYQQTASQADPRGVITRYEYDARGNLSAKVYPPVTVQEISSDPGRRGTLTVQMTGRYRYNEAGQLIRYADPRGAAIEYFYYPESDPSGSKVPHPPESLVQSPGGFLARVVRDPAGADRPLEDPPANLVTGFAYDDYGNVTTILDGRGNPTRLEYDLQHNLVSATSRQPFGYRTFFQYDANGNMVEGSLTFDHREVDGKSGEAVLKTGEVRESFQYDRLNNIVGRRTRSGDHETVHTFVRDAAENVVREIQPLGNAVEYTYDERNQLVARRLGVNSPEQASIAHTYTRNGRLNSTTDGCGHTTSYSFDPHHRYVGLSNAGGTTKKQWHDEAGNVTRVQILGEAVSFDENAEPTVIPAQLLAESWYHYDELNRLVRMDRAWRDPLTGEPLGNSRYDSREGIVSCVVQYGESHLPVAVWTETGSTLRVHYDGAGRASLLRDETGETVSIAYDENSNPERIERLGPPTAEGQLRFRQVFHQRFDELDRVVARSLNDDSPERFSYNALGSLLDYRNPAGAATQILHDAFGRLAGAATTAATEPVKLALLHRLEWDDNGRIVESVNARGNGTRYGYDALNRLSDVVYADGAVRHFERDGAGNIVCVTDPNGTVITNRFDALNRLVERFVEDDHGGARPVETYQYDGLNRLVSALNENSTTLLRYDSLSQLLQEVQSGRKAEYGYDSAGNRAVARYPGGEEVCRSYDQLGREVEVRDREGKVASYSYGTATQLRGQQLGEALNVEFGYEAGKDRLSSIMYRSAETGEVVEGSRYGYDAAGNRIFEEQLRRGEGVGERYLYDSASRLVRVQYGVERLADGESPFEQEVLYELSPTGTWQRRITRGSSGETQESLEGKANRRERYTSLGDRRFEYDANGNTLFEAGRPHSRAANRYRYDHANRLVRMEALAGDGGVLRVVEYDYDALGRQVGKRSIEDGSTRAFSHFWSGNRLVEVWADGTLAKGFVYGARAGEPLKLTLYSAHGRQDYLYALNGLGRSVSLFDAAGRPVEKYRFDAFGLPFLGEQIRQPLGSSSGATLLGNPILTSGWYWDNDTQFLLAHGGAYDPTLAQFANANMSLRGGQVRSGWEPSDSLEVGGLLVMGGGIGVLIIAEGWGLVILGGLMFGLGIIALLLGVEAGGSRYGSGGDPGQSPFDGLHGYPGGGFGLGSAGGLGDYSGGGYSGGGHGGSGLGGSSSGGSSGGSDAGGARPSGQPEDRPLGNAVDYGHAGGGQGGTSPAWGDPGAGPSTPPPPTPTPDQPKSDQPKNEGQKKQEPPKKEPPKDERPSDKKPVPPGTPVATPNPIDGTGEGIDKDWWRKLPNASVLSVAEALRSPLKFDEREGTPHLSFGAAAGTGHLIDFLTPKPITVDEGGEGVSINLNAVVSTSRSSGSSGSDGWGDKPRTLAEAAAAPRIRGGAATSKF
jgi:YD repeat-containing protein